MYDLKDHADYQYRPGTMVIRVSNFTGDDLNSTAGQVIDNFPDGRVRVWWAKGHITMCYPQDLFEIHQSDTQDAYESDDSENSWETQSENSQSNNLSKSTSSLRAEEHVILGIDNVKEAIHHLEKIFEILPEKLKPDVLNNLMTIYKNCRHLDRYLKTDFFNEANFNGILAHKKKCECETTVSVSEPEAVSTNVPVPIQVDECTVKVNSIVQLEIPSSGLAASTSTPNKRKSSTQIDEIQCKKNNSSERINVEDSVENAVLPSNVDLSESETRLGYNEVIAKYRAEYEEIIKAARANIAKASEKYKCEKVRRNTIVFC